MGILCDLGEVAYLDSGRSRASGYGRVPPPASSKLGALELASRQRQLRRFLSQHLAEHDAAIDLAGPLHPIDVAVAEPLVQVDQMRRLLRGIHRELPKSLVRRPLLGLREERATDTQALPSGLDGKLMRRCHARASEVVALVLRIGRLNHDGADQGVVHCRDEAGSPADALGRHLGRLIDRRVVQAHAAQSGVRPMKECRDIRN